MPLTPQEAFKVGFLARCARQGMTPDQMLKTAQDALAAFEKRAVLGTVLGKSLDALKGLAGGALNYGVPAAVVAPPLLGALGGYGLAKATDVDDTDVAAIKNRELIDEYRRNADELVRAQKARAGKKEPKPGGRLLM